MLLIEKADRILKDVVFILVAGAIIVYAVDLAFSAPTFTVTKVDDYHGKVEVTEVNEKDDKKVTTIIEDLDGKCTSICKLNKKQTSHEEAKQTWIDSDAASDALAEENIVVQDEKISLCTALKAEFAAKGIIEACEWATETPYTVNVCVVFEDKMYKCLVEHTSGIFADDLSAEKWELDYD